MSDPKWDETEEIIPVWDETEEIKPLEKFDQFEAGARGLAQGASFGFGDEITAGIGTGFGLAGDYDEMVEDQRRQNRESAKQWPKTAIAGEVAGSIATSMVPGVGWAGSAGKAAKLAQYLKKLSMAKKAAIGGAAYGAGMSENKLTENPMGLAKDVGQGAVTGFATQKALGGLAKKLRGAPAAAKELAEESAVKAATGQGKSHLLKLGKMTRKKPGDYQKFEKAVQRSGRDILDEIDPVTGERVLKAGDRVKDIAPKAQGAVERYGEQIGNIGKGIDALEPQGGVSVKNITNKLEAYAKTIPKVGAGKNRRAALEEVIEDLKMEHPGGKMPFGKAQELKGQFQFEPSDADLLISNKKVTNKINRIISDEMDETVGAMSDKFGKVPKPGTRTVDPATTGPGPGLVKGNLPAETGPSNISPEDYNKVQQIRQLLDNYGKLKGKYGSFKQTAGAATDRAVGDFSNRKISPSDYALGIGGAVGSAAAGDPTPALIGLTAALSHKLVRERGNATAARVLDRISKAAENSPEFAKKFGDVLMKAGEKGPAAMIAVHQSLKKNPEYQTYLEGQK